MTMVTIDQLPDGGALAGTDWLLVRRGTVSYKVAGSTISGGGDASTLDGLDSTAFARAIHAHAIGDVTGLQTALDGKLATTATATAATKLATARTINGVSFDGTANITVADATKEPTISAGTTAQYWRGDKTWQDLAGGVRATVLTGLSTATNTAITATDTVLTAPGKLQAQITGHQGSGGGSHAVASTTVAGFMAAADKTKLDGIAAGAQVNVATNLSQGARTATSVPVTSSTGTGATLDAATTMLAGVMTAADKAKLEGIAAGAQVNAVTSVAGKTGAVTLAKADVGLGKVDNTSDADKPVSTAQQVALNTKLDATANAVSASKLVAPVTINGVSFDGSANIVVADGTKAAVGSTIPSANGTASAGTAVTASRADHVHPLQTSVSGNAGTATKLAAARKINGVSFDGTSDITIVDSTKQANISPGTTAQYWRGDKSWQDLATAVRAAVMTGLSTTTATAVAATDTLLAAIGKLQAQVSGLASGKLDATANAVSASKLASARTISLSGDATGSISFDGSANVTIPVSVADDSHNHTVANVDGLQAALDLKVDKATGQSLMLDAERSKLAGIQVGAQVNVATNLAQGTRTSTGIPLTSSTGTGTTLPVATTTLAGLQSAADKAKLDGISAGAQVNTVTSVAGRTGAVTLAKTDVGLGNVDNTSDTAKPVSTAQQAALDGKVDKVSGKGLSTNDLTGALLTKLNGIAAGAQVNSVTSVAGKTGSVLLVKADVGLSNVDNTSDLNKPVSTATQTALNNKLGVTATASAAQKLATARTINGVAFDGTANITVADATKLPLAGGTLTGILTSPRICINRTGALASGISWYSTGYNAWQDYMAQAGIPGQGVNGNVTAPSGTLVTGWARRSFIEGSAGFGWTFESGTNSSTAPTVVAEIRSSDGSAKFAGSVTAASFIGSGASLTGINAANITTGTIPAARVPTLNQSTMGNASTATKLQTARTIGGVSFDGTANINLPGVNAAGNQSTSGNAATATKLQTARTINGTAFDGTANITVADSTKLPLTGGTLSGNLVVGATTRTADTSVKALASDGYKAGFEAHGGSQGTGYLYVGQEASHGGGVFYNGDGTPAFATGETVDTVAFYRRNVGVNEVVFSYSYNSNNVTFRGVIYGNGSGLTTLNASNLSSGTVPTARLPAATTSVPGAVQLNNTLTSTSTAQALTAAQGKALKDQIDTVSSSPSAFWTTQAANFTATSGSRTLIMASATVSLPAAPAAGATVELSKVEGVTPVIQTTDGRQISVSGKTDTSVTYNLSARLLVVFNGAAWEI